VFWKCNSSSAAATRFQKNCNAKFVTPAFLEAPAHRTPRRRECHRRSMPTLTTAATAEAGVGVNPHQAALKGDLVAIKQYISSGGALEVIDRNGR
jgi:hypothetical protein